MDERRWRKEAEECILLNLQKLESVCVHTSLLGFPGARIGASQLQTCPFVFRQPEHTSDGPNTRANTRQQSGPALSRDASSKPSVLSLRMLPSAVSANRKRSACVPAKLFALLQLTLSSLLLHHVLCMVGPKKVHLNLSRIAIFVVDERASLGSRASALEAFSSIFRGR